MSSLAICGRSSSPRSDRAYNLSRKSSVVLYSFTGLYLAVVSVRFFSPVVRSRQPLTRSYYKVQWFTNFFRRVGM